MILVEASSEEKAFTKAEAIGRGEEGDEDGTFRWGKHPAQWVFAGVRKLTECAVSPDRRYDGMEVTFTEYDLDSHEAVKKLTQGKPVQVTINENYRSPAKKRKVDKDASERKRRGA